MLQFTRSVSLLSLEVFLRYKCIYVKSISCVRVQFLILVCAGNLPDYTFIIQLFTGTFCNTRSLPPMYNSLQTSQWTLNILWHFWYVQFFFLCYAFYVLFWWDTANTFAWINTSDSLNNFCSSEIESIMGCPIRVL